MTIVDATLYVPVTRVDVPDDGLADWFPLLDEEDLDASRET
ncbi:hypothetical protein [Pseudoclavibacter sp. RFBA6]|nr:hypothetical protein [Pseudoclavibacter sp. RFBA6]